VRGTYGALIQIATCFGILGSLFIGIPVKEISGWYDKNLTFILLVCYTYMLNLFSNICREFVNSGGGFVSGYLSYLQLYLLLLWSSVQRVHIGYTRLTQNTISF
jgi:hypothetical protein